MRGFFTVGVWTLASRVLGFLRDAMIVAFLGTGPAYQAFIVAFSLPNLFRRFFAEGAFNMAFVPMFSKKLEGDEGADEFARDAMSALAGILIVLTLLAQVFMPFLVLAMASGFQGEEQFGLSVTFGRIAFPYILFISLAALLSGVLNATGRFAAAAAAPVLLNVLFIGAMLAALSAGLDIALALVWVIPLAGVAQMVLVWIAAKRAGFTLIPRLPRFTPELRRLAIIAAPAALAGGVVQVNLLVGRQVASYFDSAVGWLYAADRLYQLPLGVVGIAVGIVLLPELSRRLKADDGDGAKAALSRAGEMSLILTLPAAVALFVVPAPLVSVLFERGLFNAADTAATAQAVAIYGLGLPAFVIQKILQPLYFAREDTRRPFYFALVAMIINAALALGLAPVIGWTAAAIGTTVAGWAMVVLLAYGARNMGDAASFDDRFRRRIPRIIIASGLMGIVLWAAMIVGAGAFALPGWRYLALLILVLLGAVSYAISGQITGAFRLSEIRRAVRR